MVSGGGGGATQELGGRGEKWSLGLGKEQRKRECGGGGLRGY